MIERLIQACLRNRLLVVVLALLVMGAGYYTYTRLPVDAFPDVSPNLVQVFTITEGLAPEEIEKFVTYPVEVAMTGLPGVDKVRSVSNFGLSVVNVYFRDGMDIYFARQLVGERLQEAREQIPEGFGDPEMGPISTGMGQILFYYLDDTTGKHSLEELRTIQDWLVKFHLQTVPGVTEVLGIGGYEKQFHVVIHPEELQRFDLTLGEVIERIHDNNLNVGAQFIEKNAEEFVVRSVGLATDMDDLRSVVVKTEDGRPVFLEDVGDVEIGGAIRRGVQTRNGAGEVVAGMVIKLFGANSSTVIARVEERLAEINDILPAGVRVVPYYEQKSLVQGAVRTVLRALVQGVVLVGLVLLVFMGGLRPSLVVGVAIPFSVLFAFLLMGRFGISANLMSLGGLAIAIGMMVDGTIVMVENVDRMLPQRVAGRTPPAGHRPRLPRGGPADPLCDLHHHHRLPAAVRPAGRRRQDLSPPGLHRDLRHAGFVDLRPGPGADDEQPGHAPAPCRRQWRRSTRRAPAPETLSAAAAVLHPPPGFRGGDLGRVPRCRRRALPPAGFRIHTQAQGGYHRRAPDDGPVDFADREYPVDPDRRTAPAGRSPRSKEVVTRIGRGEVGAHADPVNSAEIFVRCCPEPSGAPRGPRRTSRT